jgi:hypothetical protein
MVCSLVATPRPVSAGTSCGRIARSGGRARAGKTSTPMLSLSQDVPAGPTAEIKCTDRAERNWLAGRPGQVTDAAFDRPEIQIGPGLDR